MGQFGFGQSVRRKEDPRLLTGRGQFIDDISFRHQAHAHVLRSPHAHAELKIVDVAAAQHAPGVIEVLTGADLVADGIAGVPCLYVPPVPPGVDADDWDIVKPPFPALAQDRVRLVGNAVALVLAETPEQARDASELIIVDYRPLPSVTSTAAAAEPDAPVIWEGGRRQHLLPLGGRRARAGRSGFRGCRACGRPRRHQQPSRPGGDRNPGRRRRLQPRRWSIHSLRNDPDATQPEEATGADPGRRRTSGPRQGGGRRRWLRRQKRPDSGTDTDVMGGGVASAGR